MNNAVLTLRNLSHSFAHPSGEVRLFAGAELTLQQGEAVALIGPSGSGKSTLLHFMGLLDVPAQGQVVLQGKETNALSDNARTQLRNQSLGFIYQFHHLLPELTALENAALPAQLAGHADATARAQALLETLGLGARLRHYPGELSGGEQQRTAIARALVNKPALILADEPTGNLDPATSETVMALLKQHCNAYGATAFIATHNMEIAKRLDRVVTLHEGHIIAAQVR
jgi:lipoprotein-releasing system ATP-binding protein